MYAEFFGLNRRPFKVNPAGPDVFVGPQTARIMKGFASAFESPDAIVTVTGAPGLGKSTLVRRALESLRDSITLVEFPRVKLSHDEVPEFLLDNLGASDVPRGTIRRVMRCRELVAAKAAEGKALCILVEDAERIGADALIELEALTSANSDNASGARVVLLGGQKLLELLQSQPIARILQRTRLKFPVQPLNESELRGYLRHCLRLAGTEFDSIFEAGSDRTIHLLSGGTPRLANNLVDSVLNVAAERKLRIVGAGLIADVARDEYDLCVDLPEETAPESHSAPQAREPGHDATVDEDEKQSSTVTAEELVLDENAVKTLQTSEPAVKSPLPDLAELMPSLQESSKESVASAPEEAADVRAPADASPTDTAIPTLFSSARLSAPRATPVDEAPPVAEPPEPGTEDDESATKPEPLATTRPADAGELPEEDNNDIPAWEKDPTLAELRPDLEAIELALADESGEPEPAANPRETEEDDPVVELKDPTIRDIPEITLDIAIQQKIDEATEALQKHDATIAEEEIEDVPAAKQEAISAELPQSSPPEADEVRKNEMQEVANGLAKARSLEDVDDKMAETLFGEEFSSIAAQVAANAPPLQDGSPDESKPGLDLDPDFTTEPDKKATDADAAADERTESAMEREFKQVYGEDALEVSLQAEPQMGGLDLSASQRLATVRALNAEKKSATGKFVANGTTGARHGSTPANLNQTIEEQINTSMTQTLKTMSARPPSANDEDDDDDENKRGFFSRFRRT